MARRDRRIAGALAAGIFTLYALGASRTIYVGDSGELVAAAHVLGIPHPSGYPLYVLLGKAWTTLLPFGTMSVAWRMSLFSAACAALACALLYRLCRRLALAPISALTAALLLAFAPSFWGEANVQRVYTLNALFLVLATSAALHWHDSRERRWLALSLFACGLGAANHTFMALAAAAVLGFAALVEPALLRRPLALAATAAAFVPGLLPYLYLPLRSRADPPLDWGNPETLSAFLDVVLRRDFWTRAWIESPADTIPIAVDYLAGLGRELAWGGVVLLVAGVAAAWRRRRLAVLPLLVMMLNLVALALHGSRSDIFIWHRYYIPSYAMAALLCAFGAERITARLPRAARLLPLALPAVLLATGWRPCDRSRYRIAEDFSRAVLRTLPPGARLMATDDNILFVLIYLQFVENERPDVDLILQGVADADLPALRFNPDTEPLFFTHHPNWNLPALEIVPIGLVFQSLRAGRPLPAPRIPFDRLDGEDDPRVPKDYLTQNLIGHFHYMIGCTYENRDWPRARREFARAAAASPDNDVLFYNLGLIYHRNGLLDDALAAFERSHAINPRHLASQSHPRAQDRIAELRRERERLAAVEKRLGDAPAGEAPGSPSYHRRLAELLEAAGEPLAARGQRLRAEELSVP